MHSLDNVNVLCISVRKCYAYDYLLSRKEMTIPCSSYGHRKEMVDYK